MDDCMPINKDPNTIIRMEDIYMSFPGGVKANRGVKSGSATRRNSLSVGRKWRRKNSADECFIWSLQT